MQPGLKRLFISVIQLALSVAVFYLMYQQPSGVSDASSHYLIYGLLIALILSIIYGYLSPGATTDASSTFSKILLDGSEDLDELQKTIIRIKSLKNDDNMTFVTALSALLEKLHKRISGLNKDNGNLTAQQQQLAEQINELNDKYNLLKQQPDQRSEFLSLMGDEITSPMQSLNSMLKLLNQTDLDQESSHLLKIAIHSAHSLTENITNILEFTKLDAGLLKLSAAPYDLHESISQVLETQESIALSKSLLIEKHISADVPKQLVAPERAVKKVLNNLISNAIRFTDRGSINLHVDKVKKETQSYIRFKISDTGVGIPADAIDSLFDSLDRHTRLKNSSFTGRLRLIVSKGLCELMGGEIGVTSAEGVGSQFWFTIRIDND